MINLGETDIIITPITIDYINYCEKYYVSNITHSKYVTP